MATKSDLIASLQTTLDGHAATMASEIESFRTAYIQAHAADLAILKLGGKQKGQRIDQDRLNTFNTASHTMHGSDYLFDGQASQPQIEAERDNILATLQSEHPEAF